MSEAKRTPREVTVGIPVLNGARYLPGTLAAVNAQRVDARVQLLVVDSGSSDGSVEIARSHGARVIEIPSESFSHGGTRNLIMRESSGTHVVFLTQDAEPADELWLSRLLAGFELAGDVALVFGPYRPRDGAQPSVRREFEEFFGSFSADGSPRLDRVVPGDPFEPRPGLVTFFTDANACVARWAWERVPFRHVPYAEDQMLAVDMLGAGFAKVFEPHAAVLHSHDYRPLEQLRRFFDEWRGLREVYGHVEAMGWRATPARIRRELAADRRFLRAEGIAGVPLAVASAHSLIFFSLRALGSGLGSRCDRLPPGLRRLLSLEGRSSFEPVQRLRSPATSAAGRAL